MTILFDLTAEGMQRAGARARGFLGGAELWLGLLLLSLAGFAAFKIYGRYSLPKPFRPRVRVIRTTIRTVFLVTTALSVVTTLMAGSNLYNDPVMQVAWQILRDLLGM